VDSKFGSSWGTWCSIELPGPHGLGLWKNIKRGWMMFSSHTKFELGDGCKIRFRHDVCCGEKAFKEAFMDLHSIACVKDASVAIHLELSNSSLQWNLSFIGAAHDWEVNAFFSFLNLLYSYRVRQECEDKLW